MYRYLFLFSFVIVACKKNEDTPRITIRQLPSKIAVFTVDTATGEPSLQYEINYFYNEGQRRFDSIDVAGQMYRFNYSKFAAEKKMLLNYTDSLSPFNSINFDANFYSLSSYQELTDFTSIAKSYNFQYDTYKKITGFEYVSAVAADNYSKTFLYKNDTGFINTNKPGSACTITDTLINTFIEMSSSLPYLLFLDITKDCSALENNVLKALPVSNYINRFPYKIINGIYETSYSYYGDAESRLKEAVITVRLRTTHQSYQKIRMSFSY